MKSLTNFTVARKKEGKKTLVVYVTAGLPSWTDVIRAAYDNGADIVEVGLPFSDPIMDGPVIAEASYKSLQAGSKTFDLLKVLSQQELKQPCAVMTYANVLTVHGIDRTLDALSSAQVSGLIIPDLTFEQSSLFSDALTTTDIALVELVASTTTQERRERILKASEGFVYCVAIKGVTGQQVNFTDELSDFVSSVAQQSPIPTLCGVGIRSPLDAHDLSHICDGVIVGTAVVEKMMNSDDPARDVGELVATLRRGIDE